MNTIPLESAKYYRQAVKQQLADTKRVRNRKAIHDFSVFIMGLGAIALAVYVIPANRATLQVLESTITRLF